MSLVTGVTGPCHIQPVSHPNSSGPEHSEPMSLRIRTAGPAPQGANSVNPTAHRRATKWSMWRPPPSNNIAAAVVIRRGVRTPIGVLSY